jgi:serine protease Do
VWRDSRPRDLQIRLGQYETGPATRPDAASDNAESALRLGFSAEKVTPQLARRFENAGDVSGAIVTQEDPTSEAARAGLQPGTVIERLNGQTVANAETLREAMSSVAPGKAMSVVVRTPDGQRVLLTFRAPAR